MEVNQKQLAALLGISSRQVRNLKEQGLFEFVTDSRKYNAEKCVQEYIDFKIKAEVGNGTNLQGSSITKRKKFWKKSRQNTKNIKRKSQN